MFTIFSPILFDEVVATKDVEWKCKQPTFQVPETIRPGRNPNFILITTDNNNEEVDVEVLLIFID